MSVLYLDTETFSEVELKSAGTHRYFESPSTEIIVAQWALDDEEPKVVDCTLTPRQCPGVLRSLLEDPSVIVAAHSSHFDRTGIRKVWGLDIPVERWQDTMIQAMAHGLPGGLDKVGQIVGLEADQAKDKRGRELIQLFCKPRPKNSTLRRATRETHPEQWAEFLSYSRQDIIAMRAIGKRLPTWNYRAGHPELALWHLDQRINDRGVAVDLHLANAAIDAVAIEQKRMKAEVIEQTNGFVTNVSQRDNLLTFICAEYGVNLPDMKADTLRRRMEDPELPEAVKLLLAIRLEATKTSTAKYKALVNATSADGRLRNTLQFAGAQRTERWAGRIFQPQNLPRPEPGFDGEAQELVVEALKIGCADLVYSNVMQQTANCIRGCIVAPPGKKLVVADLSNIEGRGLAFLAGETWKLNAFADFDAGIGADLYKLAYAKAFNIDPANVTKAQRQQGKVMELGCLAGDTPVVTNNGLKPIMAVSANDLLWDGQSWVTHQGVIAKGVKPVVNVAGIRLTPDHLVLTGATWTQAQQLVSSESTLCLALATGSESLPSSVSNGPNVGPATSTSFVSSVRAGLSRILCSITTFAKVPVPGAGYALANKQATGGSRSGHMPTSAQTTPTGFVYSTEYLQRSPDATQVPTGSTRGMVAGGYSSGLNGAEIGGLFLRTLSALKVGIAQAMTWTASTLIKATNQETLDSYRRGRTVEETSAQSKTCSTSSTNCVPTFDILNAGPFSRFTVVTERGPVIVHNCGYEGGVAAFLTFAIVYGMNLEELANAVWEAASSDAIKQAQGMYAWFKKQRRSTLGLPERIWIACEVLVLGWREAHPNTKALWKAAGDSVRAAIAHPGQSFAIGEHLKARRDGAWLRIRLPSGRYLCYINPSVADDGQITYFGVNQYTRQWGAIKTYGGKLCVAEGVLVLAKRGWITIENVTAVDEVWDGLEWVRTGGNVCNGSREVIEAFGEWMTPDHLVLTTKGWKDASQSERHQRAACRLPDGVEIPRQRREKVTVDSSLRLRNREIRGGFRAEKAGCAGNTGVVRVQAAGVHRQAKHNPRHEQTPCVCGVAQHDRPLHIAFASGLAQLRRSGYRRMCQVASIVREFLVGYGRHVPGGANAGPQEQRQGVCPGELPVGNVHRASQQHQGKQNGERQDCLPTGRRAGGEALDDVLPSEQGGSLCSPGRGAGRISKVYDLINCGPRHRFVIWAGGAPLIVHNCENVDQAMSRDVIAAGITAAEENGYPVVLHVHDEIIAETPDSPEFSTEGLAALMTRELPWSKGLPLSAAGFETYRYRKD